MDDLSGKLIDALNRSAAANMAITVADPALADCPLIYANEAFSKLTGYRFSEVEGSNCRFLQNLETDRYAVENIRSRINGIQDDDTCLINTRKDGTSFVNLLSLRHLIFPDERRFIIGCQFYVPDNIGKDLILHQIINVETLEKQSGAQFRKGSGMMRHALSVRADNAMLSVKDTLIRKASKPIQ